MTPPPPRPLALTTTDPAPGTVCVSLGGDLDHESAAELLDACARAVGDRPGVRELRLDCAGLGLCDSMGLSALLMVHRCTAAAGAALHLDHRTAALDRLLDLTGTRRHLTGDPLHGAGSGAGRADP